MAHKPSPFPLHDAPAAASSFMFDYYYLTKLLVLIMLSYLHGAKSIFFRLHRARLFTLFFRPRGADACGQPVDVELTLSGKCTVGLEEFGELFGEAFVRVCEGLVKNAKVEELELSKEDVKLQWIEWAPRAEGDSRAKAVVQVASRLVALWLQRFVEQPGKFTVYGMELSAPRLRTLADKARDADNAEKRLRDAANDWRAKNPAPPESSGRAEDDEAMWGLLDWLETKKGIQDHVGSQVWAYLQSGWSRLEARSLRIELAALHNLPPADDDGLIDPVVYFRVVPQFGRSTSPSDPVSLLRAATDRLLAGPRHQWSTTGDRSLDPTWGDGWAEDAWGPHEAGEDVASKSGEQVEKDQGPHKAGEEPQGKKSKDPASKPGAKDGWPAPGYGEVVELGLEEGSISESGGYSNEAAAFATLEVFVYDTDFGFMTEVARGKLRLTRLMDGQRHRLLRWPLEKSPSARDCLREGPPAISLTLQYLE